MRVLTHIGRSPMKPAAASGSFRSARCDFMNGVARSYCAGLSLAALARLGVAVAASPQSRVSALDQQSIANEWSIISWRTCR